MIQMAKGCFLSSGLDVAFTGLSETYFFLGKASISSLKLIINDSGSPVGQAVDARICQPCNPNAAKLDSSQAHSGEIFGLIGICFQNVIDSFSGDATNSVSVPVNQAIAQGCGLINRVPQPRRNREVLRLPFASYTN